MFEDLKNALTDNRSPFVWVTVEGWSFHEQPNSVKYDAETVLACESFEQLTAKQIDNKPELKAKKNK